MMRLLSILLTFLALTTHAQQQVKLGAGSGTPIASGTATTGYFFGVPVTDHTSAGVQAAIDAVPNGGTLLFSGLYNWTSGGTVTITGKTVHLVSHEGAIFFGGTAEILLVKVYGVSGGSIRNISFISYKAADHYALLLFNEQGPTSNYTVEGCEFSCPNGGAVNAISLWCWSDVANSGTIHHDLRFINNWFHRIPRMGMEFLNQEVGTTVRLYNLLVQGNRFDSTGIGSQPYNGMPISVLAARSVNVLYNTARYFSGNGIELVVVDGGNVLGNELRSTKAGANGIVYTDGGWTEHTPSKPNIGTHDVSTGPNYVDVTQNAINTYYCYDLPFTGGTYIGTVDLFIQNSKRIRLNGLDARSRQGAVLTFGKSFDCVVSGGSYGATQTTTGTFYQKIGFLDTAAGNILMGVAITGPDAANGTQILNQGSNNRWSGTYLNGVKIPDNTSGTGSQGN